MSDGPYRTLNLRQQWKRLLQRAYQWAFDSQDVIDAICPALERDCVWEITKVSCQRFATIAWTRMQTSSMTESPVWKS